MKSDKIAKKYIAIFTVLLLIFSINLSMNVSAELDIHENDGVAYDDFNNDADVTLDKCILSNGSIKLEEGENNVTYDRTQTPDSIEGWMMTEAGVTIEQGGLTGFLSKFLNPDLITSEEFNSADYNDIKAADNEAVLTYAKIYDQSGRPCYPMNRFRFQVDYDLSIVDNFEITWNFGEYVADTNLKEITMYIWGFGNLIPHWSYVDSFTYTWEEYNSTNGMLGSIESNDDYVSDEGYIDILIVGTPKEDSVRTKLYTDYVKIDVNVKRGYLPDGYVTSSLLVPDSLYGWESIIWTGSRQSSKSYVKIQVLDENEDVIKALDGNEEGFTESPIDLSSLDSASYDRIYLKAHLHSGKLDFSPRLNSWAVLWQATEGFFDSFSYDFRIDENYGTTIENGEITVSEFFSDWEIFGKDPTNTRTYVRSEDITVSNETYWYTSIYSDVGGRFHSPIVSNGKVYIASNDNKIYVINVSIDDPDSPNDPYMESDSEYSIESSLAISGDTLVFGTSELGEANSIYALNASDLSEVKWRYHDEDEVICYSSSPTIANGRVFATSWHGKFSNHLLSSIYEKIDNLLGGRLGLNNRLIVLDISSGDPIWNPIKLPASSFSTPAVADGLIYVGCYNVQGPSVFAYDENTGEQIWNASVGAIGRSSPVVADGKVFVLSREQPSLFSLTGTDKIFALDAETGEILWNVTIGTNSSVFSILLQSYGFSNYMALSPPVATPALYRETLFALSTDGMLYALDIDSGEEKWTFDITENAGFDLLPAYQFSSPLAINNVVYVISVDGSIYALDNSNEGKLIWEFGLEDPDYVIPAKTYTHASPIVTDDLILLSTIRRVTDPITDETDFRGRVYCIGEYNKNENGEVYSAPIHVQKGQWWHMFNADFTNTTENIIKFSILDKDGNELMTGLNGTNNNISSILTDEIQLCAKFTIGNTSDTYPLLKSWEISWMTENKAPEFIEGSFIPSQDGWINVNINEVSIRAKDYGVDGTISGIDVDSAKFILDYVTSSDELKTQTFDADCDGESGDIEVRVIADLSSLNIAVKDMKNITFTIKDLAGNQATSNKTSFKVDSNKPDSWILNTSEFDTAYNEPVIITADGIDQKGAYDPGASGINKIALYHRIVGSTEWVQYGYDVSPFAWSFDNDTSSGYHEFCTRATDNAGNKEDLPEDGTLTFLYDNIDPSQPVHEEDYSFNKLPEFTDIFFEDDYELESIEYRLYYQGYFDWTTIADNIGEANYSEPWSISEDDWDDMLEDESYYLYFRIIDLAGNVYETPENEVFRLIKDMTPPVIYVDIDFGDYQESGWDDEFTITANIPVTDDLDHVKLYYAFSSDNSDWGEWKQYGDELDDAPFRWEFKAKEGSGYYKFKTSIFDEAGNQVDSLEAIINVTIFPTTLVLVLIVLILMLLMVTVYFFRKTKNK